MSRDPGARSDRSSARPSSRRSRTTSASATSSPTLRGAAEDPGGQGLKLDVPIPRRTIFRLGAAGVEDVRGGRPAIGTAAQRVARARLNAYDLSTCPRSPPPSTAPARASRSSWSTASPPRGAAGSRCSADLVPRFEVIAPTLHGHDGGLRAARGRALDRRRRRPLRDAARRARRRHRALRRQLDGRRARAGAGQARPRAQRRRPSRPAAAGRRATPPRREDHQLFARNQNARSDLNVLPSVCRPGLRRLALRDVMTRGTGARRGGDRARASSVRCAVVDDVFATIRRLRGSCATWIASSCPVLVAWGDKDRILPMELHSERFRGRSPASSSWSCPGSATRRCGTSRG